MFPSRCISMPVRSAALAEDPWSDIGTVSYETNIYNRDDDLGYERFEGKRRWSLVEKPTYTLLRDEGNHETD